MGNLPPLAPAASLAVLTGLPADDPRLLEQLDAASARFREAVLHDVSRKTDVDVELDGSGARTLFLPPPLPIVSIESLHLNGRLLAAGQDYTASKAGGYIRRSSGIWPDELGCVLISYTHGYDAAPSSDGKKLPGIPDGIQKAVLGLAEVLLTVEAGIASRTVLGDTVSFGATAAVGATQQWTDTVQNYKVA